MVKRVLTSVVAFPILAFFVIMGGLWLKLAVFALIAVGLFELYAAFGAEKYKSFGGWKLSVHWVGYVFALVYMLAVDGVGGTNIMTILNMSFILVLLVLLVIFHKKITIAECAITIFGFYYVTVLMSTVYLVRVTGESGGWIVWLIFITAWGSDTGAYLTGKAIGKHKLIPTLSPNKTWEGAFGGVIAASFLAAVYGFAVSKFTGASALTVPIFTLAGFLGSIFSMFGDLSGSAIKRYTNIKDFGHILPGHGGVLDRFDSVLFTAPVIFLIILGVYK